MVKSGAGDRGARTKLVVAVVLLVAAAAVAAWQFTRSGDKTVDPEVAEKAAQLQADIQKATPPQAPTPTTPPGKAGRPRSPTGGSK